MALIANLRSLFLRDASTGRQVTTKSIQEVGDWNFFQLGNYTEASPLSVAEGNSSVISFQESDITFTDGNGLTINYDYDNQLFKPTQIGDLFKSEIRFKCKCSLQNGYADVKAQVPNFTYNPIQGETFGIPKGANVEQFVSLTGGIFVGQDLLTNGFEVVFTAGSGDFEVYDVSFLTCRVGSGS